MGKLYMLEFANGKKYIGVSENKNGDVRFYQHKYASSRYNLPVYCAWRKHGEPKMRILAEVESEDLYELEIRAIETYNTIVPNGYNLLPGGQKSPALNAGVREKISKGQKKRYENQEQRKLASEIQKKRPKEVIERISAKLKGRKLSEEVKEKVRKANIGKKHSEETKKKMADAHKGRKFSEEHRENIRKSALERMKRQESKDQIKSASIKGGETMKRKAMEK